MAATGDRCQGAVLTLGPRSRVCGSAADKHPGLRIMSELSATPLPRFGAEFGGGGGGGAGRQQHGLQLVDGCRPETLAAIWAACPVPSRDCHLITPPCNFIRCSNRDKQGVSSK